VTRPAALPTIVPAGADSIGYIRVSTEQQAGEMRTSLPEQRRALEDRARTLGRILDPAAVFVDAGISGATAEGRPAFMAMLAYCEENPRAAGDGVILVLNDSRFGRFDDPEEATHWRFVLKKLGWVVRFAEGDDVTDVFARGVIRFIGSAQASEYRANLKRTAKRASRATAAEGRWQNRAPLGYRRLATRSDGSQRVLEASQRKADDEVTRLTPGPAIEQEIVRFVFESYAAGDMTLGKLVLQMQSRWPSKRWSVPTLNAVLKNEVYVGDVIWCRRPHDKSEQRKHRVRPREEWVIVRDAHPALIGRELFAEVQTRLALNKRETRATVGGYPLSGMIKCATCGSGIVGGGGRRGPVNDPDRYRFYRDGAAYKIPNPCPGLIVTLRKRWLEPTIVREIAKVVEDARVQSIIIEELDRALEALFDTTAARRAQLAKEREQLLAKRARIVSAIAGNTLTSAEAAPTMTEIRAQVSSAEAELERMQFSERQAAGISQIRDRLVAMARDFGSSALRAGGSQLRELIRPWLASAEYSKDTRTITLKIRRIPDVMGLPGGDSVWNQMSRAREVRKTKQTGLIVTRRIKVPPITNPGRKRRKAG
jgi:DNA invertase Pin-like site-specific DNA recombinase